jgi:hypothetical protein
MSGSTFLTFCASKFTNIDYLNYLAGALGLISLINDRFAHFANKKSSECTTMVNVLLKSIGVNDTIPDISIQVVGNTEVNKSDITLQQNTTCAS